MLVVGLGGTTRPDSSSETALRIVLDEAAALGAEIVRFSGDQLRLPLYEPGALHRSALAQEVVDALRRADAVVIATPGYHGSMSGTVKNALDYVEDLRDADRPYLDGRPVGCVAVAYGWQAAVNALRATRDVVHALRGWPTPFGAAVNAADGCLAGGVCRSPELQAQLGLIGRQCVEFAAVAST
jgi:FMN reductase